MDAFDAFNNKITALNSARIGARDQDIKQLDMSIFDESDSRSPHQFVRRIKKTSRHPSIDYNIDQFTLLDR